MKQKVIAKWLEDNYISWLKEYGRKPINDFAKYLDVKQSLLSRWMNGKVLPGNENVIKLANRLGTEIYDILGWERPKTIQEIPLITKMNGTQSSLDTQISQIVHSIATMTPEERREVEEYLHRLHKTGTKRTKVGTKVPNFER